jgi:uncharacterized integral membrane protein (TIGR00698 family)
MAAPLDACRHAQLRNSQHKKRMTTLPPPAAADLYGDLLDAAPETKVPWKAYFPGLAMTIVASLAAAWLSEHYGAPRMLMGLLIGLAFNFANADPKLHPGLGLASKTLLRWGIVLAGLQVTLWQIIDLGWGSFMWIAAMIGIVTSIGAITARFMGLGLSFGTLAGGAVAICGASAALALSSLLGEKRSSQAQLTLVLVTVSAASALAMSLYPALAHLAGLTDRQAGWLVGSSIHDVAQAIGAGYSISDEAGQTATIVKLTRVALLAPALAVIAMIFPAEKGQSTQKAGLPWFVLGFLGLGSLHSFFALPTFVTAWSAQATSALLLLAVTATGIRSPMHLLLGQGWRSAAPVAAATLAAFALALAGSVLFG